MPTRILGISAFYHDSAAALVVDGEIVAAAQEERFTRKKHDHRFPGHALEYCLGEAGITPEDLDFVIFYEKPWTKFQRLLETYIGFAPAGFRPFMQAMPLWIRHKLCIPAELDEALGGRFKGQSAFCEHHESHAASAFFPSPFEEAAILTVDGVGEWATTALGHGQGRTIKLLQEIRFPHSLGLLYSAFTYYTGFRVNSGEYKVMGLAPYGEPRFKELILKHLIDVREDGSFWMDMAYFNYCQGMTMTNARFHALFGGPPRKPETPVSQREMDLAASVQAVCDEVMLRCARHVRKLTGSKRLVMAGGVALNCVANGKILREGLFEEIWIQPAAGDAGGALGAALFAWHQLLGGPRVVGRGDAMKGALLGPSFKTEEITKTLDAAGARYRVFTHDDELFDQVADLLVREKIVGLCQGRMEFGPRALGSRSIIGDARSDNMQQIMNLKTKFRESFRPFAPSVLKEQAHGYFELPEKCESPYMLLVAPVAREKREAGVECQMAGRQGLDLLRTRRSLIPAVTHVDFSARLQTVDERAHSRYHRLIQAFFRKTGCPVIINTSFNIRGEPIVCTPQDAHRCFMGTHMDALVIENVLLLKEEQPDANRFDIEEYRAQFPLD